MMNLLVVHCSYYEYPMRATVRDHLYSFRRYAPTRCFYLDLAAPKLPRHLSRVPFDLVVYHNTFLAAREVSRAEFERLKTKLRGIEAAAATKVALPQDEFLETDQLSAFINEFGVDYVFSVAPPSEWPTIYRGVDFERVKFSRVLTGYLDDKTVARIARLARRNAPRTIDVGYRAGVSYALGWHGYLKGAIARAFERAAPQRGLIVDISTREDDTFRQDEWYSFLLRCKYTIGVEGGASVLDRDGSIHARARRYIADHPDASFEEVRAACYPDEDGNLRLFALSPRHLEACATRTCQVLVEGSYDGVLEPGRHYIPLKRDLSNLDEVLRIILDDRERAAIVERAYADVVASGRYTYRSLVSQVLGRALEDRATSDEERSAWNALFYGWNIASRAVFSARRSAAFHWIWPFKRLVRRRLSAITGTASPATRS